MPSLNLVMTNESYKKDYFTSKKNSKGFAVGVKIIISLCESIMKYQSLCSLLIISFF